jgi:phage repressor protein C with HTH and peptisase S24 domain
MTQIIGEPIINVNRHTYYHLTDNAVMIFGKRLKEARMDAKLSQAELARRVGVKQGTIAEAEASGLSSTKMLEYAKALNVNPEWLATGKGSKNSGVVIASFEEQQKNKRRGIVIEQYDALGSMGQGVVLRDQSGVISEWQVSEDWVRLNIKHYTKLENLKIVTGFGDSMIGMFNSGDPLIIDVGVKVVDRDSPYFFRVGNEGFIKRLQRVPGVGLRAISTNKEYETWTITEDMDFEVFGIVLKSWNSVNYN